MNSQATEYLTEASLGRFLQERVDPGNVQCALVICGSTRICEGPASLIFCSSVRKFATTWVRRMPSSRWLAMVSRCWRVI